ncbi:hypothetical protein GCM10022224_025580 [Nonomuraea antimicrobica]|uniref:RHS repeat-associated core domain-containing protein n=1 Tax=Nonomuraea antimicrobica TaxID=561173 RepID=A0ABP7BJH8_9ACTN
MVAAAALIAKQNPSSQHKTPFSSGTGVDKPEPVDPTAKEEYNPYRFNAKRWDNSTGMYDMGFRNYNPGLNRFLNLDTYNGALDDLSLGLDPWTSNRYAFTGGNPINGIEHDGHEPRPGHCQSTCPTSQTDIDKANAENRSGHERMLANFAARERKAQPTQKQATEKESGGLWDWWKGFSEGLFYTTYPFGFALPDDVTLDNGTEAYKSGSNVWPEINPCGDLPANTNCGVVFPFGGRGARSAGKTRAIDDFIGEGVIASMSDDGIVTMVIEKGANTPKGGQMFTDAFARFGPDSIKGFDAKWVPALPANLGAFNKNLRAGMSMTEAAKATFTGHMLSKYGITEAVVDYSSLRGTRGWYTNVEVEFRRSGG